MIHMPRRSVTRFFIPLIDVLILLFCIFLLMEFNSETEVDKQMEAVEDISAEFHRTRETLADRVKELHQFEELRPQLQELAAIKKELEQLKNANLKSVQERTYIRIIDIDGKDGTISFADDERKKPIVRITDAKIAKKLIEDHTKEAAGKELYYYFRYPRDGKRFPTTIGQEQDYRAWFKNVAHSLEKAGG